MQLLFQENGVAWKLLRDDPDRYIYEPVRQGVDIPLPEDIKAGINDVSKRHEWNKPAAPGYGLPTETWREHVARRNRCLELQQKLANGEINSINDLITHNLNIRQLTQDVIENCYEPELVWAFYQTITKITILDPTCGSGAFLFSALNILEPLYEACFEQMQIFLDEGFVPQTESCTQILENFRQVIEQVNSHDNRSYFIIKSIVINNLYGVDIMQEATEICKLRLFLKLTSQVEPNVSKPNNGIEPLPDIDFNIRAGNTLVGFTSLNEVRDAVAKDSNGQLKLVYDNSVVERIEVKAQIAERTFQEFRDLQIAAQIDSKELSSKKAALRASINQLREELDCYLADEYEMNLSKKTADFENWKESHQPFHWFVEFYGIMKRGGFDVIIGNPPYIEYSKVKNLYKLLDSFSDYSTNLYSACCYRAVSIKGSAGYSAFIVPVSLPSTDRMQSLRVLLTRNHNVYQTSFSTRPSKLFEGAEQRLTIYIQSPSKQPKLYSGGYLKWYKDERECLFQCISYIQIEPLVRRNSIWLKARGSTEKAMLNKMYKFNSLASSKMLGSDSKLYYKNTGIRYFSTVTLRPPRCWINGVPTSSSRETILKTKGRYKHTVHTFLLSSTFFFHYQTTSNCRDLNPSDILLAPLPDLTTEINNLEKLSLSIEEDYVAKGKVIQMQNKLTGLVELESLTPASSKALINEIDRILAKHYGLTDDELDFIINYDIKYRMGRDSNDESDSE